MNKSEEVVFIKHVSEDLKSLVTHISGLPDSKRDESTISRINQAISRLERINLSKVEDMMQKYEELKKLVDEFERKYKLPTKNI